MKENPLPIVCPSCNQRLTVTRLKCVGCGTSVEGEYVLPILAKLGPEEHLLILNFVKANGSLKDLSKQYSLSYPTIRNRLDALMNKIEELETQIKKGKEKT
ncbi:MAG: DUF2089 family protein [Phycisphaerae bacterium]